jgi:hypothetical protein
MTCPRCNSTTPEAARFCHRCGASLSTDQPRDQHYAANPNEPVRALALVSTLMPHLSGHRTHAYRSALGIAFIATLIAGAFGAVPVAIFCAAIALPLALFLYQYDHEVWEDQPWVVIGIGVVLAGAAGVGVGVLANRMNTSGLPPAPFENLPPIHTILSLGLLVPAITFVLLWLFTSALTARTGYSHAVETINFGALVGAAFALCESIAIQHGAFSLAIHSGDPARDVFVALTLGFAKPVIYACAAALPGLQWRRFGNSAQLVVGIIEGLLLVVVFDLATILLSPYGSRGIVLTAIVAFTLGAMGLLVVRGALHEALLAEALAAVAASTTTAKLAHLGASCSHCGMAIEDDAAFCLVCGTAIATLPKQLHRRSQGTTAQMVVDR